MATLLEIPLRDAKATDIMGLQSQYLQATLRIEAENSLHSGGMDEAQFWAIIELLDWDKSDRAAIMQPAVEALSTFSKADLCAFYDLMNEKLYVLDARRFAEHLGSCQTTGRGVHNLL